MPFRPMPLLDFELGIYEAQEPYRAPANSFVELQDAYVKHGRLLKRQGYELFGQLGIDVTGETIGDGGVLGDSGTLAHYPIVRPANVDDADTDTYSPEITDATHTAHVYMEQAFTKIFFSGDDSGAAIYQEVETALASGQTHYTGSLKPATAIIALQYAINNPAYPITFSDDGTGQSITITYVNGYQYGPDAVDQVATGDIDAGGVNLWMPSTQTYDVTFALATTGNVTVTSNALVGFVQHTTGLYLMAPISGDNWSDPVVMDYQYVSQNPIMGIHGFFTRDGNEYLVANDTTSLYLYNETQKRFNFVTASDVWTGSDINFDQYAAYEDLLYINNDKDEAQVFDPTGPSVATAVTDFDGDSSDDIDFASFFLRHKNRAIYFRPSEGSTLYSQRARYTPVDDVEYGTASATVSFAYLYSDAPTADQIISAFPIGDNIVVPFNRSMWVLRYIGDPTAPYEWQRIPSTDGAVSRFGFVDFGDYVVFRGTDALLVTDGISVQRFDLDIPERVIEWNQDAKEYSYGIYVPHDRQGLMTYAKRGDSLPADVLAITLDERKKTSSFSVFTFTDAFHCFGRYRGVGTVLWDDIGIPWDDIWWAPDSLRGVSGAAIILAGDRSGNIYQYPSGYTDNGTEFTGYAKTARLNPVPGRRAHLGYVEIIADAVDGGTLNVLAYADHNPNPYANVEVDLTPNSAYDEKVIRRVPLNRIANFHTLRVEMPGDNPVAIDQIAPFFKPAGPMRELMVSE